MMPIAEIQADEVEMDNAADTEDVTDTSCGTIASTTGQTVIVDANTFNQLASTLDRMLIRIEQLQIQVDNSHDVLMRGKNIADDLVSEADTEIGSVSMSGGAAGGTNSIRVCHLASPRFSWRYAHLF
jgi:hypothetical protein